MGIHAQAESMGFCIARALVRHRELTPTHIYQCFLNEAQNEYILRQGILTIIAANGKVY